MDVLLSRRCKYLTLPLPLLIPLIAHPPPWPPIPFPCLAAHGTKTKPTLKSLNRQEHHVIRCFK